MTSDLPNTALGTIHVDLARWWMVVVCDKDWFRLYVHWRLRNPQPAGRWVFDRNGKLQHRNHRLMRPKWGTHVSFIRGEEPQRNLDQWDGLAGHEVTFTFNPDLVEDTNDIGRTYWWLWVECPELLDLREQFGLHRDPPKPLHLTLGTLS